jgi:SNF family Na+-dependent transporter
VFLTYIVVWLTAFFDSFGDNAPWEEDGDGSEAVAYFFNEIIGMDTLREGTLRPTRLVGANVGYAALVWFCVWLCLAFGTEWTGRIAYITMGLPIVFLFIFLFRSIGLEGADDGIEEYIGTWWQTCDFSAATISPCLPFVPFYFQQGNGTLKFSERSPTCGLVLSLRSSSLSP